jgi:hypothetical protein
MHRSSVLLRRFNGLVTRWQQRVHSATISAAIPFGVGTFTVYCERILEPEAPSLVRKVASALDLIGTVGGIHYRRIQAIRPAILVKRAGSSSYWAEANTCVLDLHSVRFADSSSLALKIVHETTHAALLRRGIPWDEDFFDRVERICLRREIAFCRALEKLGFGVTERIEWYERRIKGTFYTPELKYHHRIRSARAYGMPEWYIKFLGHIARPPHAGKSADQPSDGDTSK